MLLVGSTKAFTTKSSSLTPFVPTSSSSSLSLREGSGSSNSNKDPDRAHIERNLEQAMDNDWRLFRAKLVAAEQAEEQQQQHSSGDSATETMMSNRNRSRGHHQQQHAHHRQSIVNRQQERTAGSGSGSGGGPNVGDLLGAAINSIFNKSGHPQPSSAQRQRRRQQSDDASTKNSDLDIPDPNSYLSAFSHKMASPTLPKSSSSSSSSASSQDRQQRGGSTDEDYFSGNDIGRPPSPSQTNTDQRSTSSKTPQQLQQEEYERLWPEDPFASEEELPALLFSDKNNPRTPTLDKHRWAHPIPHLEPGCVLLANEKLGGVFRQTVVLIVEHSKSTGTFGVVINRYVTTTFVFANSRLEKEYGQRIERQAHFPITHHCWCSSRMLFLCSPMEGDLMTIDEQQQDSKLDLSLKMAFASSKVTYGGPVLADEYSVLHSFGEVDGARKLCPGVYIGGSEELMIQVRLNNFSPKHALFVKGHAAWVPKQLQREIDKGVWYTAAASSDLILRYAGAPHSKVHDPHPNDLWTDVMLCMQGPYAEIARRHGGTGDVRRVMP